MIKSHNNFLYSIDRDLIQLNKNLKKMIIAEHPILYAAAEQLFKGGGKRIRPALVLLIAQVTTIDQKIKAEQKRLAEITEIIHTASLVHDDIIDDCEKRRGVDTVHNLFNNKVAVLAGDFLFAQSSWYLANLNNLDVVKTISKVITDFAEGEVQQGMSHFDNQISIEDYIKKSFYKTASLIASSCKATTILSNCNRNVQKDFYLYGKHIGLAFQIIDDIFDIISSFDNLGKPAGSDLKNGNLTAPLIFALEEKPELNYLINQEFQNTLNINKAIETIKKTKAIQKSKDLAEEHIQLAIQILKKKYSYKNIENLLLTSYYILNRIN
uniref:Prenyl transferase n=1 Tax=Bostrychia simpliciuscula TaxID=324754 RepID=A0A1Z1M7M8_9FLOR|nr:prenyl transferase [Bostrychia simpliciuscula]ARW62097.1 prenyl transferase [Bostrychia simpliciuscula]